MHLQTLSLEDHKLSPQQKKLLRRFAGGKTDEQIAKEFRCRAHLIAAQRQMILAKLAIRSEAQLTAATRQFANWPKLKPRAGGGLQK